ncbi:hypothetical protein E2C01_054969 [Portunus trituberculatus]|uniref:Uncharacterized protein n=1 Tax=Portunus trituberculatus TaxID=210409 RepID=A0A5B7GVC9_PORTR|nr:hypothetical protein [Portunus trituberculatus]
MSSLYHSLGLSSCRLATWLGSTTNKPSQDGVVFQESHTVVCVASPPGSNQPPRIARKAARTRPAKGFTESFLLLGNSGAEARAGHEDDFPPIQPDSPAVASPDLPTHQPSSDNEDAVIREELLTNPPEALVDVILRQRNKIFSLKSTVDANKHHSTKVQQQRAALMETLNVIDCFLQLQQVAPSAVPSTQTCSALPSKIDSDWQKECTSHLDWDDWWESGKF